MVGAVFLHGDGSLERSVTKCQCDSLSGSLLDGLAGFVVAVACDYLTIDLEREGGREGGRERERGREGEGGRGRGRGREREGGR